MNDGVKSVEHFERVVPEVCANCQHRHSKVLSNRLLGNWPTVLWCDEYKIDARMIIEAGDQHYQRCPKFRMRVEAQ